MTKWIAGAAVAATTVAASSAGAAEYFCNSAAKAEAGSVNFLVTLSDKGAITKTKAIWHPPAVGDKAGVLLGLEHAFDLSTGRLGAPQAVNASVSVVNQKPEEMGSIVHISADGTALGSGGWEAGASTIDLSSTMKYVPAVVRIGDARFESTDVVERVLTSRRVLAVLRAKDGAELRRAEYDLTTEDGAPALFKAAHAEVGGKMKAYRRKCTKRD